MQQGVGDGMELQLLHHGRVALAVDDEVDKIDVRGVDHLAQLVKRASKRHSLGQAVLVLCLTIEVAGNQTFFSQQLGSLLTSLGTLLADNVHFFHDVLL